MIALLAPVALAVDISDDEVVAAVEVLYGKDLPEGAVCIERPGDLPGRFRDVVVAGVKRGARGCVVVGALIDDKLVEPEAAAAKALDPEAWKLVDDAQRAEDLLAWTDEVLLAFDQPLDKGGAQARGGRFVVERAYLHRDSDKAVSARSLGTWTFDAEARLVESDSTPEAWWRTVLTARPGRLEGIGADVVQQVMTSQGRVITGCFTDHWSRDLTLAGGVQLAWSVTAGKVGDLTLVAEPGKPAPEALARCYASAIRKLEFPPEANGTVRWVFVADRREHTPGSAAE
jgi:hypothetical protein